MTLDDLLKYYDRGMVWTNYDGPTDGAVCAICGDECKVTGVRWHFKKNVSSIINICRECDHKTRSVKYG